MKKIVLVGVHGTGKSKICNRIFQLYKNVLHKEEQKNIDILIASQACLHQEYSRKEISELFLNKNYTQLRDNIKYIPEQFREVVKDIPNFTKQTEEITLATYAKQLYLENLYTTQGKNILCDRSVLDTFVYYDYFNPKVRAPFNLAGLVYEKNKSPNYSILEDHSIYYIKSYSKIYLIEPSDREIENDCFRMTDKKQQLEIHKLFLEYFKDFSNVEIVNQEDAHKEEFIEKVASEFIIS